MGVDGKPKSDEPSHQQPSEGAAAAGSAVSETDTLHATHSDSTPPSPAEQYTPSESSDAKSRIEATSAERTQSLKAARQAALSSPSHASPAMGYAQSPNTPPYPTSPPPPRPHSDPSLLTPQSYRTGLITGLRRLGYILSLALGSSAVIGLFWSAFILPLLHSTFSARQVILEQQSPRFDALLSGLKALRSSPLYPPSRAVSAKPADDGTGEETGETGEKKVERVEHRSGIREISSDSSASSSTSPKKARSGEHKGRKLLESGRADQDDLPTPANPLPLDNLASLSTSLKSLSSAISSTSTTRTSLLSTLETYTAQLHREVYLRNDHKSSFSVGLGSLSQNLANVSGSSVHGPTGISDSSDWDDVRKEVRAIKGLLLGRRNFMPQPVQSAS